MFKVVHMLTFATNSLAFHITQYPLKNVTFYVYVFCFKVSRIKLRYEGKITTLDYIINITKQINSKIVIHKTGFVFVAIRNNYHSVVL